MEFFRDLFMLLGRILISGVFLWGAYERITNWKGTMARMKAKGVPQLEVVLPVATGLRILGALLVLFGWHAHIGALLLLIVAIPSALKLHQFWAAEGRDYEIERALFMKEVAIIGGLLLLLALGGGNFSA